MPHLILALMNDALPVLPAPSPLQVGERVEIVERVRVERHPIDPEADDPGAAAAPTQRHRMVLRVAVARTETAAGEPRVVLDVTGGWIDTARGEREPHPLAGRSFVLGPGFDVLDPAVGPATPEPVERVVQLLAATMHEWAAIDAVGSFSPAAPPQPPSWPAAGPVRWEDGPALPVNDDAPVWRDASVTLLPGGGARRRVRMTHDVADQLGAIRRTGDLDARATYRAADARLVHMHVTIADTAAVGDAPTPRAIDAGTSRAAIHVRWR